jgi:hypothetical protein
VKHTDHPAEDDLLKGWKADQRLSWLDRWMAGDTHTRSASGLTGIKPLFVPHQQFRLS